jgi:hypothetical protein
MKKVIASLLMASFSLVILAGCAATDVVAKFSPDSFSDIINAYPEIVVDNTLTDHYYYLSVDKETTLKISHDYERTGTEDIMVVTPLKAFTDAGLDVTKLSAGYRADDTQFYITVDYGKGTGEKSNVTDALFDSVTSDRSALTYHQLLDHYGIKVTGGKFEFAKDYTNNDKDIVFVLQAKPLEAMGVDVHNVDGWIFKTMQDTDGSDVDVLLKPYDLNA